MSRAFALATPHRLATEAGAEAFRGGGNAIDAAVAAAAALTVVYPHNCAIGGDVIALVATPDGSLVVVNGSGASAAAASAAELRKQHAQMPAGGAATVTVPGAVAAWASLLALGGRRTLAQALEAAIAHAEDGVPVARSLAAATRSLRDELAADKGASEVFLRKGAPLGEAEPLRQPSLAHTLRSIAANGPAALYGGEVGAHLLACLRSRGSQLTPDDLAAHETELAAPIAASFGELEVLTGGPNSQGFVLLEILAGLEACGDGLDVGGGDAGTLARLFALTASDRERYLADPRFAQVPVDELLSPARAIERASVALDPGYRPSAATVSAATGDTVAIVAADSDGHTVSLIQSIFFAFGARILDPATGILVHNRGASFSLDPASPNVLEGRKRPAHTLMPVLVREGGRVVAANGTMGGRAQAQIHAHLLLAARDGASPHEAVRTPRWTVGTLETGGLAKVVAERDVAPAALASIREAGFAVETVGELDEEVGHAQAIAVGDDGFTAGSDPRADGTAVVGEDSGHP